MTTLGEGGFVSALKLPPKAQRRRAVRAELLLQLGITADHWAKALRNQDEHLIPFEQWDDDDPLKALVLGFALKAEDVARVLDELGEQLEQRAIRAGYGDLEPRSWE